MRSKADIRLRIEWCRSHLRMARNRLRSKRLSSSLRATDRWFIARLRREIAVLWWVLGGHSGSYGGTYDPSNIMTRQKARDAKIRCAGEPKERTCRACGATKPISKFEKTWKDSPYRRRVCTDCQYSRISIDVKGKNNATDA